MSNPVLEISRDRFRSNIAAVRARLQPTELMLVMKDDAYGHGLDWSVPEAASAGVTWFGGYDIDTALRIRALTDRHVYAWANSAPAEVEAAIVAGVQLGIGSAAYLRDVIAAARRTGIRADVHLKIDTGLHRNGFRPDEWPQAVATAREAEHDGALRVVGVWSHLAEASDAEDDAAQRVFDDAVRHLTEAGGRPEVLHLTASAASWWRPELRGSLSRIGAFCYGVRSADGPVLDGISPIARLVATVDAVTPDAVIVGAGAFHGLPSTLRGTSAGTPGGPRRILRIDGGSMHLEPWDGAEAGQRVVVFGPGDDGEQDATALAEHIDTVGEEVITRLTPAVRRIVTD
ncbi:alanine racemase [Microbacterium esteraromaticum]|uniref:alanine racemase n=1 Tax=Microbacterium esteraromaticum TaxID=57043 RepID=UPI001C96CF46|nr:alanine racemase [Microbacterium esteraromaticum]MBY6061167.1 alanine racemase [Microbacterium esteraromaticum]